MSQRDAEKRIHGFIWSQLDCWNGLVAPKLPERILLIQNSAARLLTSTNGTQLITGVVAALHWLPVTLGTGFLLVYKPLKGLS